MLRRMLCVLGLALLVCTGCGDGGAEVSKKQFALLSDLRDTMAKVKDAATLKTELPNLEKIIHDLVQTEAELSKQQISTEQARDLRTKYGKEWEVLGPALKEHGRRIEALENVDDKDLERLTAAIAAVKTGTTP